MASAQLYVAETQIQFHCGSWFRIEPSHLISQCCEIHFTAEKMSNKLSLIEKSNEQWQENRRHRDKKLDNLSARAHPS